MHKLSSETSKLISSAQVATSVSNVVKELTENALDAGATSIQVKLVDFGLEKIEVRDNGCGIKAEEMKFAAQRHYTSKLRTDKDLLSLLTYGFRGEALSSACEVSDVCITTKTSDDAYSTAYTLDSKGSITFSRPTHLGQGTTVVITNIFKNLPVRKSYYANLKKRKEQLKLTEDMLIAYALANPLVHLSLSHNKTVIWQKPACKTLSEAVVNVLGSAVAQNLEEKSIGNCDKTVAIHAFIPKKIILRRTCDRCYVLINKRPIREKQIDKTIKKILGKGESEKENNQSGWPTAILSITLPTDTVDVNVNPNKTQVMLTLKEEVLKLVENLLEPNLNLQTDNITNASSKGQNKLDTTTEEKLSLHGRRSTTEVTPTEENLHQTSETCTGSKEMHLHSRSLFEMDDIESQDYRLQSTQNNTNAPSFPDFDLISQSCLSTNINNEESTAAPESAATTSVPTVCNSVSNSTLGINCTEGEKEQNILQQNCNKNDIVVTQSDHVFSKPTPDTSMQSRIEINPSDMSNDCTVNPISEIVKSSDFENEHSAAMDKSSHHELSSLNKKPRENVTASGWSRGRIATDENGSYIQPVRMCTGIKRPSVSLSPSSSFSHQSSVKKPRSVFDVLNDSAKGLDWENASASMRRDCVSVACAEYDKHKRSATKMNKPSSKERRKFRNSFINLNKMSSNSSGSRNNAMPSTEDDLIDEPTEFPLKFSLMWFLKETQTPGLSQLSQAKVIGMITDLEYRGAVISIGNSLYLTNLYRLQEQCFFNGMMKTHLL
ncbi:uncharacterized protein LOC113474142 [Ciona intestinalis]